MLSLVTLGTSVWNPGPGFFIQSTDGTPASSVGLGGSLWRNSLKADSSHFLLKCKWGWWSWPNNTSITPETAGPRRINILRERTSKGILLISLCFFISFNKLSLIFVIPQIREDSGFPFKCFMRLLPSHHQQVPCDARRSSWGCREGHMTKNSPATTQCAFSLSLPLSCLSNSPLSISESLSPSLPASPAPPPHIHSYSGLTPPTIVHHLNPKAE